VANTATATADSRSTPVDQGEAVSADPAFGNPDGGAGLELVWLEEREGASSDDGADTLLWSGSLIGVVLMVVAGYRYWRLRDA